MNASAKIGRPSMFSDDLAFEIVERLSKAEPLAVICRDAHMPSDVTVRNWMKLLPEFSFAIAHAREVGFDVLAHECIEIAEDGSNDYIEKTNDDGSTYEAFNAEHVQRSKLRIETRLKLLSKWDPKRYGDLKRVEMSGIDGGAIQVETHEVLDVSDMSAEERAVLREALERTRAMRAVNITKGNPDE